MITPAPRINRKPRRLFKDGASLVLCGQSYQVIAMSGTGGFGEVYVISAKGKADLPRVVKFLRGIGDYVHNEPPEKVREITEHLEGLFRREWQTLKRMSAACPRRFPAFYGSGRYGGYAFYIMECLEPVDVLKLQALRTDVQRVRFIDELCQAVGALHESGLVHYDIKPQNILIRQKAGDYVLGDFGSVHKEETHKTLNALERARAQYSLSRLMDGRRISPRTVGYCDPIDSLHTRHADIYAIGQVMRDMFSGEVPAVWSRIILKCINRSFEKRYDSVDQVRSDVLGMGGGGASRLTREISKLLAPDGVAWLRDRKMFYVKADARPGGSGTECSPFPSISAAVEAAVPDSVILVGAGVYEECICLRGRRIDLISAEGPSRTVICGRRGFAVVQITEGADGSLVKGFTITGGTGGAFKSSYGHDYYGGGINANVSATIEDCVIAGNGHGTPQRDSCTFGGGACVSRATVTFRNCRICDNYAWASGGGLMADGEGAALVVVDSTIERNGSEDFFGRQGGIAIANSATLSVSGCVVADNAGDQIGAFGNVHANGTRAQVERSYVKGGVKACNIQMFIDRPGNFKSRPRGKDRCGCGKGICAPAQAQ